jgi:hypothetical protein
MSNELSLKNLNVQQLAFLNALSGEAKGNLHIAKDMAGYAPTTAISDVVRPLKDYIAQLAKDVIMQQALKAAFALGDVMDNPAEMGAANKVKAATEVLNRAGIGTPEDTSNTGPKAAVILLPAKDVKVKLNGIEITTSDDEPKIIEGTTEPSENP